MSNKENQELKNTALTALKTIEDTKLSPEERERKLQKIKELEEVSEFEFTKEELSSEELKAASIIEQMFSMELGDEEIQEGILMGVKKVNERTMQKAKDFSSEKLSAQIGKLRSSKEGNEVFECMIGLNKELKTIHPSNYDMTENFFSKIFPFLSPVTRYFKEFESTKGVIDSMKVKLEDSIDNQRLDINILKMDKRGLSAIAKEVKRAIEFNKYLLENIKERIEREEREEVIEFLESQVQFNITREIQGLQELLTVNMQGQQSFEMLIRAGNDLIDSAERCVNVSVSAIIIAAVIAHVVADQKRMLDGINAVNKTAGTLLEHNAKMLSTSVLKIAQDAVNTNLDVDMLVNAINMSVEAVQADIDFRINALPLMEENINKLSEATAKAEKSVNSLERSRSISENYSKQAQDLFKY